MRLLTEVIDDIYIYDDKEYPVDMSFNNILVFTDMWNDKVLDVEEKLDLGISLLINPKDEEGKEIELDIPYLDKQEIIRDLIENYIQDGAKEETLDRKGNPMPVMQSKPNYSIKHDDNAIFASFMQTYHMDLDEQKGKLHWKKFVCMLEGLPSETRFKEIIDIRQKDMPKGKGSEKERAELKKLKRIYALPEEGE